jgi:hypothetical protein
MRKIKDMFRLHRNYQVHAGPTPPPFERHAVTQKAIEKAPTMRAKEEAQRMGDALAHHQKKETVSIK